MPCYTLFFERRNSMIVLIGILLVLIVAMIIAALLGQDWPE